MEIKPAYVIGDEKIVDVVASPSEHIEISYALTVLASYNKNFLDSNMCKDNIRQKQILWHLKEAMKGL